MCRFHAESINTLQASRLVVAVRVVICASKCLLHLGLLRVLSFWKSIVYDVLGLMSVNTSYPLDIFKEFVLHWAYEWVCLRERSVASASRSILSPLHHESCKCIPSIQVYLQCVLENASKSIQVYLKITVLGLSVHYNYWLRGTFKILSNISELFISFRTGISDSKVILCDKT